MIKAEKSLIKSFLNKWWILVFLSFIAAALVVIKFTPRQRVPETPSISPSPSPTSRFELEEPWQEIATGQTAKDELINQMGTPLSEKKEGEFLIYEYSSNSKARPNQVFLKDEKVVLTKEQITEVNDKSFSFYLQTYGQPKEILYGPHAGAGFQVALYSQSGLAVVYSPIDGTVLEVWHFSPTTKENFLNTLGKDLKKEEPKIID